MLITKWILAESDDCFLDKILKKDLTC